MHSTTLNQNNRLIDKMKESKEWWKNKSNDDQIWIMMKYGFSAPFNPSRLTSDQILKIYYLSNRKQDIIIDNGNKTYVELSIKLLDTYDNSSFGFLSPKDKSNKKLSIFNDMNTDLLNINQNLCIFSNESLIENGYHINLNTDYISKTNSSILNNIYTMDFDSFKKVISHSARDRYNHTLQLPDDYIELFINMYNSENAPDKILLEIMIQPEPGKEKYIFKTNNGCLIPKI